MFVSLLDARIYFSQFVYAVRRMQILHPNAGKAACDVIQCIFAFTSGQEKVVFRCVNNFSEHQKGIGCCKIFKILRNHKFCKDNDQIQNGRLESLFEMTNVPPGQEEYFIVFFFYYDGVRINYGWGGEMLFS